MEWKFDLPLSFPCSIRVTRGFWPKLGLWTEFFSSDGILFAPSDENRGRKALSWVQHPGKMLPREGAKCAPSCLHEPGSCGMQPPGEALFAARQRG
jgi:hypothetical protein